MDIHEYFTLTQNTRNKSLSETDWLLNSCLGLSEVYELEVSIRRMINTCYAQENIADALAELGDVVYYNVQVLNYFNRLNQTSFPMICGNYLKDDGLGNYSISLTDNIKSMQSYVFEVQELVKKLIYHDKDTADKAGVLATYIYGRCVITAWLLGFSISDVMEANIAKLKKRYPDGFNAAFPTFKQ